MKSLPNETIGGPVLDVYGDVCGHKVERKNKAAKGGEEIAGSGRDLPRVRIGFRPYQWPVFHDRSTGILVLHWSRQIGKSFTLAAWAVDRLLTRPGRLVTVLSNSRDNGAEFVAKCAEVCRLNGTEYVSVDKSRGLRFQNMRMEVRIRAEGKMGRIKVLAANPRTARGFSGVFILDEFAFHEDSQAIWEAAEPILASNPDFLCRIASTGNGKHNLFYRMTANVPDVKCWEKARANEGEVSSLKFEVSSGEGNSIAECGIRSAEGKGNRELKIENLKFEISESNAEEGGRDGNFTEANEENEGEAGENSKLKMQSEKLGERGEWDNVSGCPPSPQPSPPVEGGRADASVTSHVPLANSARDGRGVREDGNLKLQIGETKTEEGGNEKLKVQNAKLAEEECRGVLTGTGIAMSPSGFAVSRMTRTMAHGMGVRIFDANTRAAITPEQARAQALDKRAYDQNYECAFADENLTLLSHELISAAERDDVGFICEQDWSRECLAALREQGAVSGEQSGQLTAHSSLFVGVDVGRNRDLSVITVIEKMGDLHLVRGILRMQNLRLPEQQLRLGEICRLKKFRRAAIDMTGLGLGLFEYAQEAFGRGRIAGINFASTVPATRAVALEGRKRETVRVTEALAMELLQVYEDRRIRHPADGRLRDDLRKPERITTPGGRVSIAATRDEAGHADHFWSFALALEAAGSAPAPFYYQAIPRPERGAWL